MNRVWHPWHKWECFPSGFFSTKPPEGMSSEECINYYAVFLSNLDLFEENIKGVMRDWPYSCQHFLTNKSSNRIAWIGQSSCCFHKKIPSKYRSGFKLLSQTQQKEADELADYYLQKYIGNKLNFEKLT